MNDRHLYDLSHLSHIAGHIGRLQTVSVIPIEAGASLDINLDGIARLAPTRKEIVSECVVDLCAFFVPHRHVYGQDWVDFITGGVDENITFTGVSVAAAYRTADYLCQPTVGATINRSLLQGYNRIYHQFYAVPSFRQNPDSTVNVDDYNWFPTTETGASNCRKYGRLCARLPHPTNGATMVDAGGTAGWNAQNFTDADAEVPAGSTFDLRDMADAQSRYETEAQKAWFTHFYQDVMEQRFNSILNRDVDPRYLKPEMLARSTKMMSGMDIDGTDDATLGSFQGKTLERVGMQVRRKYFSEHGNVFILALLRYPLVHTREQHPLLNTINWTYDEVAGDPSRLAALKPVEFDPTPWINGGTSYSVLGNNTVLMPYGQHYRTQPNRVHNVFQQIPGYPFSNWNGTTTMDWLYHQDNEYRDTFQTSQIGQWQMHAQLRVMKYSPIPGVQAGIFAGSN